MRIRRSINLLLLLGFLGLFTHELLPGHAQEHGNDHCQLCENWLHQAAVESAPIVLPEPQKFALQAQDLCVLPDFLVESTLRLRGPPASLTVL